jgi:hypothetical protein
MVVGKKVSKMSMSDANLDVDREVMNHKGDHLSGMSLLNNGQ